MNTRQLLGGPALAERPPTDVAAPDPYVADRYFTDGINLFRLAGWLSRPRQAPLAELEDCRSLHSTLLERDGLVALDLRPVLRDAERE